MIPRPGEWTEPPFVTVVVPTHNRRELLERLLDSLAAQAYPSDRFEVLVMDNASSDGTAAMVESRVPGAVHALRLVPQNNRGPALSRHNGLRMARGEIVAFTDSDCTVTPDWIGAGVAAFAPGVGLVQGRTLPNPAQPRHLFERTIEVTRLGPVYETCNIFYRTADALEAGGFSGSYDYFGEDTYLAWRVLRMGRQAVFSPEALVHHEVFRASLRQWLTEPRFAAAWPHMVKTIPELRAHLYHRYFLLRVTAMFDLALVGVALAALAHPVFAALILPYAITRYVECGRHRSPWLRLARILVGLPRALVLFTVLLYGSARHRSLVL
ncbi:MAG: glycosyltransferase [Candidatus Eisenbacteria bacterium]|nr:glycosyltransferase [Candidatus Eisenbacteria bacterium]